MLISPHPSAQAEPSAASMLPREATPAPPDPITCEAEPITRLERIQAFGFLIAMSADWIVVRTSANVLELLGLAPTAMLGKPLDAVVNIETLHEIRNRMFSLKALGGTERWYGVELVAGRGRFDIAVHYAGELIVVEGETAGLDSRIDAASLVRTMVGRLSKQTSLDAFHRDAARQVRSITGFDRVMIYRFAADGAGEVIAEAVTGETDSFLGLHYPASDIPAQARALYLLNPFRIIADVKAPTVELLPAIADVPLDLSLAFTRAVSPTHIEYLENMGVSASASISIIIGGALWGLIACHHHTPRLPTFVVRTAAELFGQMYSMKLESRIRDEDGDQDRQGRDAVQRLVTAIAGNAMLLDEAQWLRNAMAKVIQCDGIAVYGKGLRSTSGATPFLAHIEAIVEVLDASPAGALVITDELARLCPAFCAPLDGPAGLVGIPTSVELGHYLLLFRQERRRDILWAGAPGTMLAQDTATGPRLSPRKSFAAFSQSIRGRSRPFTARDCRMADSLRTGLVEIFLRDTVNVESEQKRVSQSQELLIAELNHRVRNVLALIRGLISQTHGESGDATSYVRSLNGRVQALARAHDKVTRQNWGPGPLNALFDDEIAAYVPASRNRFVIGGANVALHPQAFSTLALVIHELVTNSAKYGSLSGTGRVDVDLELTNEGLHFRWRESGGPPVSMPSRRGFGSVIIERVVPFDLQGRTDVRYLPRGFEADFFIPGRHIAPVAAKNAPAPILPVAFAALGGVAPSERPLHGLDVLLLEDNLIVALEAEELLRSLGAESVFAASNVSSGLRILEVEAVDFAVLDINLGFETSLDFAVSLRAAGIPYLFASGYGESRVIDAMHDSAITLSKPYDRENLAGAIASTLAVHTSASGVADPARPDEPRSRLRSKLAD